MKKFRCPYCKKRQDFIERVFDELTQTVPPTGTPSPCEYCNEIILLQSDGTMTAPTEEELLQIQSFPQMMDLINRRKHAVLYLRLLNSKAKKMTWRYVLMNNKFAMIGIFFALFGIFVQVCSKHYNFTFAIDIVCIIVCLFFFFKDFRTISKTTNPDNRSL